MGAETGDAFQSESACKPGSVPCGGSHSSRTAIADGLKQPTRPLLGKINRGLLGLASDGACNAVNCCQPRGGLLPRLFTLTGRSLRFVFCCAFRKLTLPRCYLASLPMKPGLSSPEQSSAATARLTHAHFSRDKERRKARLRTDVKVSALI